MLYLLAGLLAPLPAVIALDLWWLALAVAGTTLAVRRSAWVLAVPPAAALSWFAVISAGGAFLGWRA